MNKPADLPTFSDEEVERLGEIFVDSGVYESYGVTFGEYLNAVTPVLNYVRGGQLTNGY